MFWKADLGYLYLGGEKSVGTEKRPKPGKFISFLLLYCGVFLPLAAAAYESWTHVCAQTFFDPLPGTLHTMLFALVPLSNFFVWLSLRRDMTAHYGFMIFANGMAVGVGLLYTLMFLPIMPISCVAIIIGLGFFGLAPFISLISLWRGGVKLNKLAGESGVHFQPHQISRFGHLVVLAIIVGIELPSTLTRIAVDMACQGKQQGLDILRTVGNREVMLRACYERSGRATDILGSLYESNHRHDVQQVRQMYYHVTGHSYNSMPIPESARATIQHVSFDNDQVESGLGPATDDEFDLDPDVAGEMVSGVSRGLGVSDSRLNVHIDAAAAIAQCDWYLSLDNKSNYDREVRAKVKLPTGAVVDGASLIVEGKEYESAILVREEARTVYKNAVAKRQNPLLVSTCGPDSVLVQCYPVPPKRDIKLRLRIAAPLALDSKMQGVLSLPQFQERNFQVDKPHSISIDSSGDITFEAAADFKKQQDGALFITSGNLSGAALACGKGVIHVARGENPMDFAAAINASPVAYIKESIEEKSVTAPARLRVVIDGSVWLAPQIKEITEALRNLPAEMKVTLVVVTDKDNERLGSKNMSVSSPEFKEALEKLERMPYVGGQYDFNAVWDAVRAAHKRDDTAALWIHGPQPYTEYQKKNAHYSLNSPGLERYFASHPERTLLYDLQVATGPNEVLASIKDYESINKMARSGSVGADLSRLFDTWKGTAKAYGIRYEKIPAENLDKDKNVVKTGLPIAKLWAAGVINANTRRNKTSDLKEDTYLAGQYHIVTPVSSAVLIMPVPSLYGPNSSSAAHSVRRQNEFADFMFRAFGGRFWRRSGSGDEYQFNALNSVQPGGTVPILGKNNNSLPGAQPLQEAPAAKSGGSSSTGHNSGITDPAAFNGAGAPIGTNPLVPESDSWLLIIVTGAALGCFIIANRKPVVRKA